MDYTLQEPAPKKKAKPRTQASRRRQNVPFKPDELMKELSAASKTASAKSADENGRGTKYPNVQSYYNVPIHADRLQSRVPLQKRSQFESFRLAGSMKLGKT